MKHTWFLALFLCASNLMACTLNIVYSDVASPPWYLGDGETQPAKPGIAVELANMAAAKMNCKIAWQRMPNRRVQLEMEGGRADAMLLFSYSPERTSYAVYPMVDGSLDPSLRLTALTYRIYVRDNSPLTWDGKQFDGADGPLGANAGYSVAGELRKLGRSVEEAPGTEQNFKKLLQGRTVGYVMQDLPADTALEELGLHGIRKLPMPFSTKDYYLPFSKKFYDAAPATVMTFWKKLADVRKTHGKALLKKYSDLR